MMQSRCQGKVDGTVLGVILFRLTENSILMNEIFEKTWNEELNELFLVKIQLRENRPFLMVSFLFREKSKKACIGKPLLDRELEKKKEKVLLSCGITSSSFVVPFQPKSQQSASLAPPSRSNNQDEFMDIDALCPLAPYAANLSLGLGRTLDTMT